MNERSNRPASREEILEARELRRKKRQQRRIFSICLLAAILVIVGGGTVLISHALKNRRAAQPEAFSEASSAEEISSESETPEEVPSEPSEEEASSPAPGDVLPPESSEEEGSEAESESEGSSESGSEEESSVPEESEEPAEPAGRAEEVLASMTEYEKVCQLFMVFPNQLTGVYSQTVAGESTRSGLEQYPVGGVILDQTNMASQAQVREMIANMQSYSQIPLLFTCDEEGGRVGRLMSTVGTTWVDSMLTYKDMGPETARQNALTIATDMRALGFNMDLAPVADVWSNPSNTVIGDRAYSDDFDQAASLIPSAVEGFQEGGVACTLKHFPGHGDTSADSHYGAVYVYKTLDEIRQNEFKPFIAGIDAGADCVMIGHLIVSDIEDTPALFSYTIVTELLREELGFSGVVMTDSLQMQAMTDYYSSGTIAVKALQAGCDLLLCPGSLSEAISAVQNALETGEISRERLDESVLRILKMKERYGVLG